MMLYPCDGGVHIEYSHKDMIATGFDPSEDKKPPAVKKLSAEAKRIIGILSDHQWHKRREAIENIGVMMNDGISNLPIAQSDSGKYICIPGDDTPKFAPDGT